MHEFWVSYGILKVELQIFYKMLYNYQLYSLLQLLFFNLRAYDRILSFDRFIAHSTEKTETS